MASSISAKALTFDKVNMASN